jgi:chorismate mutase/prephenate dehydrogenase
VSSQSHEEDAAARIGRLRQDIIRIDQQILTLVSWRMKVAEEIGEAKREAGLPVRDFRREVEVFERTRTACEDLGLDPELGVALLQTLIEGAVRTQHGLSERAYTGTQKSVLVVGGAGRMGSWLCDFFASQGHRVSVYDPGGRRAGFKQARSLRGAVADADVIALATPMERTARLLDQILSLGARGLVFDICSLKSPVVAAIERAVADGLRVASVHPMFAPGPVLLSGRILVVCDCGNAAATAEARALFEDTALRLVDVPLLQHDRLMSYVLGLSHAVNIAFACALSRSGLTPHDLDHVASTTFSKQMRTTREVALENPLLYYEIQHANRHTPEVLSALRDAVDVISGAAAAETGDGFAELMAANRAWLEGG